MTAWIRTQWVIVRSCFAERLAYRGDFVLGTLFRFLPIVTQVFLWGAILKPGDRVASYSYEDIVAYQLFVMLARAFSSMPGLSGGIAREVRDGTIKKYLTQPVDMLGYLFWYRVAHKLVYYGVSAIPFAIVFWLCRGFLPGWPDAGTLLAFAASLVMSFLIGFLIEALLGLISFWFLEVSSLLFIYMMVNYLLSGHMMPLEMLQGDVGPGTSRLVAWLASGLGILAEWLPFKYLAYFPAKIFLGGYTAAELRQGLLVELTWVIGLFVANRVAFARGVRRYSAFGG
jgi:ABC-2 type transport system permease protein